MSRTQLSQRLALLRRKYFVWLSGGSVSEFVSQLETGLTSIVDHAGKSPMYPENIGVPKIDTFIQNSTIPEKITTNPELLLAKLHQHVQGSVKAGDPFMVKNIIPTVSTPSLSAYVASSLLMGNGVTGEDSAQTLLAEIACSAQVAKLVGWDPTVSAGVFTFGGTGTNLYGIKIGLSKVDPQHGKKGISKKVACIESAPSHYCHATATDWLGIGTDNLIRVSSNPDQTTKMDELEVACYKAIKDKKRIVCINALAGTTSNMGIDNIKAIYDLRNRLVREFKLDYIPHIHADAVLGWPYLVFNRYDFKSNPLGFKIETLQKIRKILRRISTLKYADSFGIDFHKTGFVAYNSSMVMVKNREDFKLLRREGDIMTPLFHNDHAYNPGKYTLETSRSAANMLGTWVALQTFGYEGYQVLLGHALEMGLLYRSEIEATTSTGLFIANQESFGPDVFVRCYPPTLNASKTYKQEMTDDKLLKTYSAYTTQFAEWLESKKYPLRPDGFAVSRSSAAVYTHNGNPVVALRIYPLSPFTDPQQVRELVRRLVLAKQTFDQEQTRSLFTSVKGAL